MSFKLLGIKINLHWSLIILIGMLFFQLFPMITVEVGGNTFVGILTSLVSCFIFIASVLFHEFAHALVGQRFGIVMDEITLFFFGGAAHMKSPIRKPAHEFWMALAGPVSSFVLGLLFLAGTWVSVVFHSAIFASVCGLATYINFLMGVFNLLPLMFPMDGARLVRAIVWKVTKNYRKSTIIMCRISQVTALLFAFGGLVMMVGVAIPFLGVGVSSGMWTIIMAGLIFIMAKSEIDNLRR